MNVAKILKMDVVNGDGFRVSLFVSGCNRKCKGCFNQQAQDPNFGYKYDEEVKNKIFKELENDHCSGLSLLGGDPMSYLSDNRKTVIQLCKEVKEKFPNKTIFMWTGYTIEEVLASNDMKDIVKYVDVIIDGPFIEELKDIDLKWRGSSNQKIIYTKDLISNNLNNDN